MIKKIEATYKIILRDSTEQIFQIADLLDNESSIGEVQIMFGAPLARALEREGLIQ